MELDAFLTRHDRIVATHELLAAGWTEASLRTLVAHRRLDRLRKGWFGAPDLPVEVKQAARVGGRITCESAAVAFGLWVPSRDDRLHVAVLPDRTQLRRHDRHSVRLSDTPDPHLVLHWTGQRRGRRDIVPAAQMLVDLAHCRSPEFVFVVAESALFKQVLTRAELLLVIAQLPRAHAALLAGASSASESGGESLFLLIARELRLEVRQQVWIGADKVDFLIGERLVVEIDGRAFHDRARDNRRDARLISHGAHVLHFDSDMVLHERALVVQTLLAAIARGEHRA